MFLGPDPFISVQTNVKDPKACIYNHKVSAIFLSKGQKNVLEYRKGACLPSVSNDIFLPGGSEFDRL